MTEIRHLTADELDLGLENIRQSPRDEGELQMIVGRPDVGLREVLAVGQLNVESGLVGDNWERRPSSRTGDGSPHPDRQITLMNSRVVDLVAQNKNRWALAGDQLFVDLDLSADNLPPGMRLKIGSAVIEMTAESHTGCHKFAARFGVAALKFINTRDGQLIRMRGIYAKVVQAGAVRVGDRLQKIL